MTATNGFIRSRDLFVHDGAKLRRVRLSVPVQALFFVTLLALVGWCAYATARLVTGTPAAVVGASAPTAASLEDRARKIEQRQAVIEAMLVGDDVDPALLAQAAQSAATGAGGPLEDVEDAQAEQAALVAQALEARYQVTAAELKKLGLTPKRIGADAVGGPLEPITKSADPTFKALFNSWKKLDQLQDSVIAVPSDKPVKTAAFTSSFGVRSDPFKGSAAMHAGIDLAGPVGTPIYATADGVVSSAGWNSGGYGNLVKLEHGRGIETRYGHLSSILVRPGQRVRRGDLIARMGSTGRSTGSHLHYEVRIDGRAVNPIPFMRSTDYLLALRNRGSGHAMDQVALGGPTGAKK